MIVPRRRYRIALLVSTLEDPYQMSLRAAVGRAAEKRKLDLIIAMGRELDSLYENERAMNVLYDWLTTSSVDGVVVVAAGLMNRTGREGLARLCGRLAPVPACTVALAVPGVPAILINNRSAMRAQVDHLAQYHGRRRIAYVGGPSYNAEALDRLEGYRDALQSARLEFDAHLVDSGDFTLPTGRAAMQRILDRTDAVDAVVAANDSMAQGVMETLLERGLHIPRDVLVAGFDDAPVARFALRSLTTVAQPFEEMADSAVDVVLRSIMGAAVPPTTSLDASIIRRESCGCGYVVSDTEQDLVVGSQDAACDLLRSNAAALREQVLEQSGAARRYWEAFIDQMIEALAAELAGQHGVFARAIEQIAERLEPLEIAFDEVAHALLVLRRACREAGYAGRDHIALQEACLRGLAVLSSATTRRTGRRVLRLMESVQGLRQISHDLARELSPTGLAKKLFDVLPSAGVRTALVSLLVPEDPGRMQALLAGDEGQSVAVEASAYPCSQLFPTGFPRGEQARCLTVLPLTFGSDVLGLVAFGGEADPFVCETIRNQLSASLALSELHARVLEETAMRERISRDNLRGELAIARRIQTALLPTQPSASGLEIEALMAPADQVGGDYYDVINTDDGCWIAIGDVTGHGVLAGMVMLMIQSAVAAIVYALPQATPAAVVRRLNRVICQNVRQRLNEHEHATFVILRYLVDGRVTFAGAHDDFIVYRAARKCCERYTPSGVWLGISEEPEEPILDQSFALRAGDLLLLYTDGLTEARSATGEMFGIERAEELLKAHAHAPAAEILEQIRAALRSWSPVQQDDVTLVLARRRA